MESWIRRACRNAAYRRLVFATVILSITLFCSYANRIYLANFFDGPFEASKSDLELGPASGSHHEFLKVHGEKLINTGLDEITTHTRNGVVTGQEKSATYDALVYEGKILLVKSKDGVLSPQGEIRAIPADVKARLFSGEDADLESRFYPYMLDASDSYRLSGYWGLSIALLSCVVFGVVAYRATLIIRDVSRDATINWLETSPNWMQVAIDSEREMKTDVAYKISGVTITQNFAIEKGVLSFHLYKMDDLLWLYQKVTRHSINLIPTHKTFEIVMIFPTGEVTLPVKKQSVESNGHL